MRELSPREREVVSLLLRGLSVHECCERLGVALHTLRNHCRNAYAKLAVGSRDELLRFFAQLVERSRDALRGGRDPAYALAV